MVAGFFINFTARTKYIMITNFIKKNYPKDFLLIIIFFSCFAVLIHLYSNLFANYGIFRDEFYYIACSKHLAAGYVDQPPFSIFILAIVRLIFGESLFALRLFPALISGIIVFITGLITYEIGGKKTSVFLACLSIAVSPIFLGMNLIYSMNTFDMLFWILGYFTVIRMIKTENKKLWIWLGVIMGLGLLNKISMGWFAFGLFASLILTNKRIKLKSIDPWISFLIAAVIFSPFLIWNFTHDFAHLEFIRNASQYKYSGINIIDFLFGLIPILNPAAIFIWLPGIFYFFFNKDGKNFKQIGIIFVTTLIILIINGHSKSEYLTAAFPPVFAGGSILVEKLTSKKIFVWIKFTLPVLILAAGLLILPFALPILPVKSFIKYENTLGRVPRSSESKELSWLPQFYADMFGWEKMAKTFSDVYENLPDSVKASTFIFVNNYGEAGALQYYCSKYNLPPVVSPHNNYWYWGLDKVKNKKYVIILGGTKKDHYDACSKVDSAAVFKCEYCMPYENNQVLFFCKLKENFDLRAIWIRLKSFI